MSVILGAVLSSSVIAAIVTYLMNIKIKNKELLVQIKLQEQNKWMTNIDESLRRFVELNLEHIKGLLDYSVGTLENDKDKILKQRIELNKAQHSLIFYINQLEYNETSIKEIMDTIQNIVIRIESQTTEAQNFRNSDGIKDSEATKKIRKITSENEKVIGNSNISLAMQLGKLMKEEKKSFANEVIENRATKTLMKIF